MFHQLRKTYGWSDKEIWDMTMGEIVEAIDLIAKDEADRIEMLARLHGFKLKKPVAVAELPPEEQAKKLSEVGIFFSGGK